MEFELLFANGLFITAKPKGYNWGVEVKNLRYQIISEKFQEGEVKVFGDENLVYDPKIGIVRRVFGLVGENV